MKNEHFIKFTKAKLIMSNKKQTAVKWLHVKLAQSSQEELVGNINLWFQQAKEMEKQQIYDALTFGYKLEDISITKEQYYTETYEK